MKKYHKNNTQPSIVDVRRKYSTEPIDKPICSCEAFNHEFSNNKPGITHFKEKSPLNKGKTLNADNRTTLSFEILEPPKSKMVLKTVEASLLNEVIVQNETYV